MESRITHHVLLLIVYRLSSGDAAQVVYYLPWVGVALLFVLGVDLLAVNCHLELPIPAPGEGDSLQVISVFLYQFARQPDGSWPIVSFLAVYYLGFHMFICVVPPVLGLRFKRAWVVP